MQVTVNIPQLLEFFDLDRAVGRHSSAVKLVSGEELCLAVLLQHLNKTNRRANSLDISCVGKGAWLDKWIEVHPKRGQAIHYQVEVKCWSLHGYGPGEPLAVDCAAAELRQHKIREWGRYWDTDRGRFKADRLDKVLKPMKQRSSSWNVKPLACLWAPVHPEGKTTPWFEVPDVKQSPFSSVQVFSVSGYLRNYLRKHGDAITLPLPDTAARLEHLARLFQRP
jgi:hypothetical protein